MLCSIIVHVALDAILIYHKVIISEKLYVHCLTYSIVTILPSQ